MGDQSLSRSNDGVAVINNDVTAYRNTVANKKRDKYIKGLEQRIIKLESAMDLLQKTVKEITK